MKGFIRLGLVTLGLAACGLAQAQVTTNVYSNQSGSGDGSPFSGLVGTLHTAGITFATDFGWNWHPFGLSVFGSESTGTIVVASDGNYQFALDSDDGSALYIDGQRVIDNGGGHGPNIALGTATLTAGTHQVKVNFFEDFGGESGVDLTLPSGVAFAVPEPATAALWLAGVILLAGARFVRRR